MTRNDLKQIVGLNVLFLGIFFLLSSVDRETVSNSSEPGTSHSISQTYFAGKTIEWVVPFKEGGGADTWARFNAQYLSRHLPGNPTIVINNIPGGGSIKGTNLFASRVKPDGLMILGTSGSTQMPFLLDDPRVRYDYADYRPVMAYGTGGVVYVSPDLEISDATQIAAIKHAPLVYASQGPTSLDLVPTISFELLGLNVRTIFGFRGRGAGRLAFERGEVKIDYQTSSAYLKNVVPLVEGNEAVPLWSWGIIDDAGDLVRDPSFPGLPHFGEVYEIMHGQKGEGIAYQAWLATMAAGFGGMKLLLVPRDTPDEIVSLYHEAIIAMKKDPEYLAKKAAAIGLYDQVIGEEAWRIFNLATQIGKDEKMWCKDFLRDKFNLNI